MSFLCHYNDILHNSNFLKYKDISDNLCHMSLNLPFSYYSINFIALKFQLFQCTLSMARYLLDTNIFTFLATDEEDRITDDVRAILQDYEKTGTRTQVPHCAPVYEASTNYSTKQDRRQAMHTKSDTLQRLMRSGAWVICPNLPQD